MVLDSVTITLTPNEVLAIYTALGKMTADNYRGEEIANACCDVYDALEPFVEEGDA